MADPGTWAAIAALTSVASAGAGIYSATQAGKGGKVKGTNTALPPENVAESQADTEALAAKRRRGAASTLLSGESDMGPLTGKKTLLGG